MDAQRTSSAFYTRKMWSQFIIRAGCNSYRICNEYAVKKSYELEIIVSVFTGALSFNNSFAVSVCSAFPSDSTKLANPFNILEFAITDPDLSAPSSHTSQTADESKDYLANTPHNS